MDTPVVGGPADFAEMLWLLRRQAGWTQEDLAGRTARDLAAGAGIGVTTISELERRKHPTCHKETASRLADAFGLTGPARDVFIAVARGRLPATAVLADGIWPALCEQAARRGRPAAPAREQLPPGDPGLTAAPAGRPPQRPPASSAKGATRHECVHRAAPPKGRLRCPTDRRYWT